MTCSILLLNRINRFWMTLLKNQMT